MNREPSIIEPPLYIGEWIKVLKLKQKNVAQKAGISAPYLNQLIKGGKENPTLQLLIKIAEAMDLTLHDLQTKPPTSEELEAIRKFPASLADRIRHSRRAG